MGDDGHGAGRDGGVGGEGEGGGGASGERLALLAALATAAAAGRRIGRGGAPLRDGSADSADPEDSAWA